MRLTLDQRAHLVILYSEPHRHYHTTEHIYHCLRELESIPNLSESDKSVLELAIWFHDSVYDPKAAKGHNEMASADLLYSSFSGMANSVSRLRVARSLSLVEELITATINHQIPDRESPETERLLSYFLDIDLSILGQPQDIYDRYSEQIRKEYSFVPLEDYYSGRRRVLLSFVGRDTIYLSKHFQDKYELEARKNISRELLSLVPAREVHIRNRHELEENKEMKQVHPSPLQEVPESYLKEQVISCLKGKTSLRRLFACARIVAKHLSTVEKDPSTENVANLALQLIRIGNEWDYEDLENSKTRDRVRALLESTENKESAE